MIGMRYKTKDGFTLVESVLSALVLGIALGACILSFSMGMRMVNTSGNQVIAIHTARDALESLRTNSFNSTALTAGSHTFSNAYFTAPYTVTSIDACNKTVAVSMPYLNKVHRGSSTNVLTTVLSSTLH
jgi:type II secretory pathway pseudopilin PulG